MSERLKRIVLLFLRHSVTNQNLEWLQLRRCREERERNGVKHGPVSKEMIGTYGMYVRMYVRNRLHVCSQKEDSREKGLCRSLGAGHLTCAELFPPVAHSHQGCVSCPLKEVTSASLPEFPKPQSW